MIEPKRVHTGLVVYSGSKWSHVDAPKNDYMGFVAVDNGFYSSGHPGSSDFHGMTVGYRTHTIYVFNAQPNPKMKSAGLYYTKDDAKTWSKSEMNGFSGEPLTMATHPSDDKVIVLGSKEGLYLSNDFGNHFEKLFPGLVVASSAFCHNGELFIASANSLTMFQVNLSSKEKKEIKLPTLDKGDAISNIAQNPKDPNEIVLSTFKKDIFISKDVGAKWTKIADKGNGISK